MLQKLLSSSFLRHNAIFFVGSMIVGVLNYLYYPVLGRMLAPAAFGEVQTLISLFLQITIFLTVLGLVTIGIVANYRSVAKRNAVVLAFEQLALIMSVGALVLTIAFQAPLKHFLQFDSSWPFVLLMIALVASVPLTFRGAFLRGKRRFGLASAVNVWGSAGKIICSAALVAGGLGAGGAIGGLVVAQVIATVFAIRWATANGLERTVGKWWHLPNMRLLMPELPYGALVLTGSLLVTLQYSLDVIVVKHYFDPHTAGLYASIASVARIVFFTTAPIALVLMPLVRLEASPAHNRQLLVKSLALAVMAGLPPLVLCMLVPRFTMSLLMGQTYIGMAGLLPRLGLAIGVVSIINIIISYYVALRRYSVAPVIVLGAAVTYALIIAHHGSVSDVVNNMLAGSIAMLCALIAWMGGSKLQRSLHERKNHFNYYSRTQRSAQPKSIASGVDALH